MRSIGRWVEICLDVDAEDVFVLFYRGLAVHEVDDLPAHVLTDEHHADGAFPTVGRALEAVERVFDERYQLVVREVLDGLRRALKFRVGFLGHEPQLLNRARTEGTSNLPTYYGERAPAVGNIVPEEGIGLAK